MSPIYASRYTAFAGDRLVGRGSYAEIAQALRAAGDLAAPVLVFDDATGAPVDAPPRPENAALLPAADVAPAPSTRAAPGRPRLGVVAREVTLLPRHWDWLGAQPGGASAALRRLVDQARKTSAKADSRRQAGERSYNFMGAIAGHRPGFEEAARALFAANLSAFDACIAAWPPDVRSYLAELAQGAFDTPSNHHTSS